MEALGMARTIEELDREISTLRAEVDLLKQQAESWPAIVRQFAGSLKPASVPVPFS